MKYCNEFGKRLRDARQSVYYKGRSKKGMSQNELAEAVGISSQMVSAYEKQDRNPSIEVAAMLASELGVSLDYLCGIDLKSNNEQRYERYPDAISLLAKLPVFFDCSCSVKEIVLPEEECEFDHNGDPILSEKVAVFYIKEHALTEFVTNWTKMYSLYEDGVISEDLLSTWYHGEIERLGADMPDYSIPRYPLLTKSNKPILFGFKIEKGDICANT